MNHSTVATLIRRASLASGIVFAASACGSTAPTPQLVDARRTYNEASSSEAARLTPDKLLTAQQALEQAERAHSDDPGSAEEKHLAYLAARRSAMAIAYGKIAAAKETEEQSEARYQSDLRERATSSEAQLSGTQAELEAERQKRMEAEKRAASALQSLAAIAKVNQEQRGTVITLPGGVLFPSGGSTLSSSAQQALDRVADALTAQPVEAKISIEGHTDARGSDSSNMELSRERAESVRAYLVQKGMEAQRVTAVGRGEGAPIANNDSAEGRATNRCVEIVVSAASTTSPSGSSQTTTPSPAGSMPSSPGAKLTPEAATPTAPPSAVNAQH